MSIKMIWEQKFGKRGWKFVALLLAVAQLGTSMPIQNVYAAGETAIVSNLDGNQTEELSENSVSAGWVKLSHEGIMQEGRFETVASAEDVEAAVGGNLGEVYELIVDEVQKQSDCISLANYQIPAENISDIARTVLNENPDLFYVQFNYAQEQDGYITNLIPDYSLFSEDITGAQSAYEAAISDALSNIEPDMTEWEKALVLHDWLVIHCRYDYENANANTIPPESATAYGALVKRVCICSGYVAAYKVLAERAGMTCIGASSERLNHGWNLIRIDGKYYHVDCTFDELDSRGYCYDVSHTYFMRSDDGIGRYDYEAQHRGTSPLYDDDPIQDTFGKVVFYEDYMYCANFQESLLKINRNSREMETIFDDDIKPFWNGMGTLCRDENILYYNNASKILSIDLDEDNIMVEYAIDEDLPEEDQIRNINIENNGFYYIDNAYKKHNIAAYICPPEDRVVAESLEAKQDYIRMQPGDSHQMEFYMEPEDACDWIFYLSDKPSVATVDKNGLIQATGYGYAAITAKTWSGIEAKSIVCVSSNAIDDTEPVYGTCGNGVSYMFEPQTGKLTISGNGAANIPITTVDHREFRQIEIADGITEIGDYFFHLASYVTEIEIPASVKRIGKHAFYECKNLKEVHLHEGLSSIDNLAFAFCGIESITLPDSVNTVAANAFSSCEELVSLYAGKLGSSAVVSILSYLDYIKTIRVSAQNSELTTQDGILYNKAMDTLLKCPKGRQTDVVIPNGVEVIETEAFSYCRQLESVRMSDSVTTIKNKAFNICGIKTLELGKSVREIGSEAFKRCMNLKEVQLPRSVISVGDGAFNDVDLTKLTLGYQLQTIGSNVFSLELLDKILIPDSVVSIGENAFWGANTTASEKTIQGYAGSYAQTYASEHGYQFEAVTKVQTTGISFEQAQYAVPLDTTVSSHLLVMPENVTDSGIEYAIANTSIATVDRSGRVTGVSMGATKLIASTSDGSNLRAETTIQVTDPVVLFDYGYAVSGNSVAVPYNTALERPENPVRYGYTFDNWYAQDAIYDFSQPVIHSFTLTANWIPIKSTVTFHTGAGTIKGTDRVLETKEVTFGEAFGKLPSAQREGYAFQGWYTEENAGTKITASSIVNVIRDTDYYAGWKAKLSCTEVETYEYTGKAIKPDVTVKFGDYQLVNKKDYTLSYKKNKEVGEASITVKGKGNYKETCSVAFQIEPRSLSSDSISYSYHRTINAKKNDKKQKLSLKIYNDSVKLKEKTDYLISYQKDGQVCDGITGAGEYQVVITADGAKKQNYKGSYILSVKVAPYGEKVVDDFTDIRKAGITLSATSAVYSGENQMPVISSETVSSNQYVVNVYKDNKLCHEIVDAGTYQIVIKGQNDYSGSIKKKFSVKPFALKTALQNGMTVAVSDASIKQNLSGAKPRLVVTYQDRGLVEGVDYTCSYSQNKKVGTGYVNIKGIGNYKGTLKKLAEFQIAKKELSESDIQVIVADKKYTKKMNYKASVAVYDNGKKLSAREYTIEYQNQENEQVELGSGETYRDIVVIVKANENGNYSGQTTGCLHLYTKALSSLVIRSTSSSKEYTGKQICPNVVVRDKQGNEIPEDQYTITYGENTKAGKGTIVVTGNKAYGGKKTLTFWILPKWLSRLKV